jgi:hypothetical protein
MIQRGSDEDREVDHAANINPVGKNRHKRKRIISLSFMA